MKILVALSRFPYPTDKGDKLRAYYQLKSLSLNHEIYLVCLNSGQIDDESKEEIKKYCKELHIVQLSFLARIFNLLAGLFSTVPFQVHYFRSSRMKSLIAEISRIQDIDVCYVQLIRLIQNLPGNLNLGFYLDYMDCFSKGMKKRYQLSKWFEKPLVAWEARRLQKFENVLIDRFQGFSIISENDRLEFEPKLREKIDVIPNGVNEEYFDCNPSQVKKFDLIFTGNMGYHPNIQACKVLVKEIKPLLQKRGINVRICLAGTSPSREVLSLASEDVVVTGFVKDLRGFLSSSRIFVAPLFTGSGLQNKLLESMAAGLPTVTTTYTNKALGGSDQENIFLCDSPAAFVDTIEMLMKNPAHGMNVAAKGKEFIRNTYNWNIYNRKLETALESCVEKIKREICHQEEKLSLTR